MAGLLAAGPRLDRAFFARRAPVVAKALLGTLLVHGDTAGVVVETEAYDEADPASHSHRGRTPRNTPMFGPAGHAYVYFSYGAHWCFNVVTGREGSGEAVLIRALEPVIGIEEMALRRKATLPLTDRLMRDLARGPGRLTQALAIGRELDGSDLVDGPIAFHLPEGGAARRHRRIQAGPRVGITKGAETAWRFSVVDSPFVSRR